VKGEFDRNMHMIDVRISSKLLPNRGSHHPGVNRCFSTSYSHTTGVIRSTPSRAAILENVFVALHVAMWWFVICTMPYIWGDVPRNDMPHDPADQTWKSMNTVDSVASQPGFIESITKVVEAAFDHPLLVVGCRRGKHRSPVVAAGAAEILQHIGFSVAIVELELVQPFLWVSTVAVAQDDRFRSLLAPLTASNKSNSPIDLKSRLFERPLRGPSSHIDFDRSDASTFREALVGCTFPRQHLHESDHGSPGCPCRRSGCFTSVSTSSCRRRTPFSTFDRSCSWRRRARIGTT